MDKLTDEQFLKIMDVPCEKWININDEQKILDQFEDLKNKLNKYLDTIKKFGLRTTYDLTDLLQQYGDSVWQVLFDSDPLAQLEFESCLDKDAYITNFKLRKNIYKNEIIERAYFDLLVSSQILGIDMEDCFKFELKINFISYENTKYTKFIEQDINDFLIKYKKFIGVNADNLERMINNHELYQFSHVSGVKYQVFYQNCERNINDPDYVKKIKTTILKINK